MVRLVAKSPRIRGARGDLPFAMVPGARRSGPLWDLARFQGVQIQVRVLFAWILSPGRAEAFGLPMHRRKRGSGVGAAGRLPPFLRGLCGFQREATLME